MTFNISIGFHNVKNSSASDSKSKLFSLFLADTVEITEEGKPNIIMTESLKRRLKSNKITIVDDDESDEEEKEEEEDLSNYGRGQRRADIKATFRQQEENEAKRQGKQ